MTSGVPDFPVTLPAKSVVGRLASTAGPAEAVPIAALSSQLADASTITFLQSGAGAVARSEQAKERDVVSVLDFYANGVSGVAVDPTGAVDSTLGISAAITAVLASAVMVALYAPGGTYLVTSQLTAIPGQFRLYGDGRQQTT